MEEADRKGDGDLWFTLRDKKTLDSMNAALKDAIRKGGRARPAVRYEPLTVRLITDRAVLIGRVTDRAGGTTQYQSVLYVVEDGAWKISREQWSDSPIDSFVLYGWLPPEPGAFAHAGSPWKRVPYASINTEIVGKKDAMWKMQAVFDESFLYLRYEWFAEIPAPGAKVKPEQAAGGKTGGPPSPPAMEIKLRGAGPQPDAGEHDVTVSVSDVVSITGANRYSVNYSMSVKNAAGQDVFEYSISNDSAGHLLAVQDRFIDLRIPLAGLGMADPAQLKVNVEEAGSVLHILPYTAERFPPR
jgi:hypothetical protein